MKVYTLAGFGEIEELPAVSPYASSYHLAWYLLFSHVGAVQRAIGASSVQGEAYRIIRDLSSEAGKELLCRRDILSETRKID